MKTSPECRVSHPHVIDSQSAPESDQKYWQITGLFRKDDPVHKAWLSELHAECQKLLAAQFPDESRRPKIAAVTPVKDGDAATDKMGNLLKEKYPEYEGCWLVRASAKDSGKKARHRVVDPSLNPITDDDDVYGGCVCRINVNPYWRKVKSNPGISLGLQGVQKIRDDEPFGSGPQRAEDMFDKMGADDPANYDDPFNQPPPPDDDIPF